MDLVDDNGHGARIAIASDDFRTVSAHGGKCRRFLVYEVKVGAAPREIGRLDLPSELAMCEFKCPGPHPLDRMAAVITRSAGPDFVRRMALRGVQAVTTGETDPATAATRYLAGTLLPASPCEDHDHHHDREGNAGRCCCG